MPPIIANYNAFARSTCGSGVNQYGGWFGNEHITEHGQGVLKQIEMFTDGQKAKYRGLSRDYVFFKWVFKGKGKTNTKDCETGIKSAADYLMDMGYRTQVDVGKTSGSGKWVKLTIYHSSDDETPKFIPLPAVGSVNDFYGLIKRGDDRWKKVAICVASSLTRYSDGSHYFHTPYINWKEACRVIEKHIVETASDLDFIEGHRHYRARTTEEIIEDYVLDMINDVRNYCDDIELR